MTSLWYVVDSIFIVIFNSVYFLAGGVERNTSEWISYGFIHFAYALLLLTPRMIRPTKRAYILGLTLLSMSSVYFLLELLVGAIFIIAAPDDYTIALITQNCLAGMYGFVLIVNILVNAHTENADEIQQSQIAFIKTLSSRLERLMESIKDSEAKKRVETLFDEIYSSPVHSHPMLAEIENRIDEFFTELQNAVTAQESNRISSVAGLMLDAVRERNRQARLHNM